MIANFGEVLEVKTGEDRMAFTIYRAGTTRKVSRDVLRLGMVTWTLIDLGESEFPQTENINLPICCIATDSTKFRAFGTAVCELFYAQFLIHTSNHRNNNQTRERFGNDFNYIQGRIATVINRDFRILLRNILCYSPMHCKNMMETVEHISPSGQEIAQYSYLDLVRELAQQIATPSRNIRRHVMNRKAEEFVGDNLYFD
ncbi:unnamed protein product [Allacma fusca]|uniref:Uncharacterized protein n=1 Tax=Allacma fusca TaxID=39272 RepID=A0A8J2PIX6_9HEXA|nr:unnamed protein product [Allacma fusca]